jgi:alpha-mannosidase
MPHAGDGGWRAAGVDHQAALLNAPLFAAVRASGDTRSAWSPFTISGEGAKGVMIAAMKRAEDDDDARLILCLVETHGGACDLRIDWTLPARAVETLNLLEQPMPSSGMQHDAGTRRTGLTLRPFQIITLAIALDRRR